MKKVNPGDVALGVAFAVGVLLLFGWVIYLGAGGR